MPARDDGPRSMDAIRRDHYRTAVSLHKGACPLCVDDRECDTGAALARRWLAIADDEPPTS